MAGVTGVALAVLVTGVISWKVLTPADVPSGDVVAGPVTGQPSEQPPVTAPRRKPAPKKGVVLPAARPTGVRIPGLGVSHGKPVHLGLNADGTMEVPRTAAAIGWYAQSPTPGARGPAVLAAHVTYNGVDGVFRRLADMKRGDKIEVTRTDGRTAVFTVHKVGQYTKEKFPTEDVYGNLDHAGLRLITCAGPFDPETRRYPDNIVVFAKLTDVRQA